VDPKPGRNRCDNQNSGHAQVRQKSFVTKKRHILAKKPKGVRQNRAAELRHHNSTSFLQKQDPLFKTKFHMSALPTKVERYVQVIVTKPGRVIFAVALLCLLLTGLTFGGALDTLPDQTGQIIALSSTEASRFDSARITTEAGENPNEELLLSEPMTSMFLFFTADNGNMLSPANLQLQAEVERQVLEKVAASPLVQPSLQWCTNTSQLQQAGFSEYCLHVYNTSAATAVDLGCKPPISLASSVIPDVAGLTQARVDEAVTGLDPASRNLLLDSSYRVSSLGQVSATSTRTLINFGAPLKGYKNLVSPFPFSPD
jgi:hypothetical protein